ncbi:hypothetical protein ES703_117334 [subsurface metagenome]
MKHKARIYDKPDCIARYTLITPSGSVYDFSNAPYDPQGVGQFCGDFGNDLVSYKHLGKPVKLEDLNEDCQRFIKERIS